jgi:hypothetical protein
MPQFGGIRPIAFFVLLGMAAAATIGCEKQEPLGQVEGRVTLDGRPVTDAAVVFENREAGVSVTAELDADGRYRVETYDRDGLPPGTYQVAVRPGTAYTGEAPLAAEPGPGSGGGNADVPEKYRRTDTSGLSAEVELGKNELDFELQEP